jgi:hypothetical protein
MIDAPINETLPATGETPVEIETGATGCSGWVIQARGSVDMKVSNLSAMTTYWTVKSGTSLAVDQVLAPYQTVLYAVSGSDADTVELVKVRT